MMIVKCGFVETVERIIVVILLIYICIYSFIIPSFLPIGGKKMLIPVAKNFIAICVFTQAIAS